eukprot:m.129542 g.129542  ORF g.129542 m.129542 type:complete len:613 (-) comp29406_c0_seq1:292-2130(-)
MVAISMMTTATIVVVGLGLLTITSGQVPPTPTGEGGHCPFFSNSPGATISGGGTAVCASPSALRKWQGLKFGLFLHWGAYSQIGKDASWSLNWDTVCTFGNPDLCAPKNCSECTEADMTKYRTMYWGLSKTFNPTKFNPMAWATAAENAGMKYFVMTTKHHDGFAMYNTSAHGAPGQPVYGVTGPDCPTQRDLFGEVVTAMRSKDMMVGAYYSKADWHSASFWDDSITFPTDRNVNYDITKNASKWQTFVDFDKAQFDEIQKQYAPDIYWLDAGWVGQGLQYLPLADWATQHRQINPQQLWVNRDGNIVEDYLTPENPPPASLTTTGLSLRPKPWEVCMTLGEQWAYKPNDTYKTTQTIVQTLVSVVATGGSLLLDIGPMPTGELPPTALDRLAQTGKWMDINSESIYDTVPQAPFAITTVNSQANTNQTTWGLLSQQSAGLSASCADAAAQNPTASLNECQAKCDSISGCNTINFRAPTGCIPKICTPPGSPLVTKDGGFDVYCHGCANQTSLEWRLTRKQDFVYATLLLDNQTLPNDTTLELPFIIDVAGGVDGSWPFGTLTSVTLLGAESPISFSFSDVHGLVLTVEPQMKVAAPYAAVFKLDYTNACN